MKRLPLGPAVCELSWCSKMFVRTAATPMKQYCSRKHLVQSMRERRRNQTARKPGIKAPQFVRDMMEDVPNGMCIFCEREAARVICKEPECKTAYNRLYKDEQRAKERAARLGPFAF